MITAKQERYIVGLVYEYGYTLDDLGLSLGYLDVNGASELIQKLQLDRSYADYLYNQKKDWNRRYVQWLENQALTYYIYNNNFYTD